MSNNIAELSRWERASAISAQAEKLLEGSPWHTIYQKAGRWTLGRTTSLHDVQEQPLHLEENKFMNRFI